MSDHTTLLHLNAFMRRLVVRSNALSNDFAELVSLSVYYYVDTKDVTPLNETIELVRNVYGASRSRDVVAYVLSQNPSLRYDFKAKSFKVKDQGENNV